MNEPLQHDGELLAIAETIANIVGARMKPGTDDNTEARLRASMAAARYARDRYVAMLESSRESRVACRFLSPAAIARERENWQLRHQIVELIAELSLDLSHKDLMNVADVVSTSGGQHSPMSA